MATKYNCEINGIKYFRKTKTIGYDEKGKAIKKPFYGDGEKDCDRKIEEYMNQLKNGINMDVQKASVEQLMYDWLFNVLIKSSLTKSASFEKHETNYRLYIKGSPVGFLIANKITSKSIQSYYNNLYEKGINKIDKNGNMINKKITSDKIFDINKTLRLFFTYCISQNYRKDNPCSLECISIPGNADIDDEDDEAIFEYNIQAFNDNEIEVIKNNLQYQNEKSNTFNVAVLTDLVSGLRKGELLGLQKKYVDLVNCTIRVRWTLKSVKVYDSPTSYHRELKLIKPKSKTSIREISFPRTLVPVLEKYFKEQEIKWKENGLKFDNESLMFTTKTCKPINNRNFLRAWKRFLNKIKIEYKKPHSLRDTYATTLIRRGASIHDVKALLGHSSIKITEKYYIYVFPEDKSSTANLISDFIVAETK